MKFKDFFMQNEIEYDYFLSTHDEMLYAHAHPKFELYFCAEPTKQRSVINGNVYTYDFPCVIISAPYTIHSMSSVDSERYERMVIYFGERTLSQFGERISRADMLKKCAGYFFELTEELSAPLKEIIYPAMLNAKEISENEKELRLMLFINKLLEICPSEKITTLGATDLYLQEVLKYISQNFGEGIGVDDIAKRFNVSRSKLDRDFKRYSDCTAHDFLDSCRLNEAKRMLLHAEKFEKISDISELCGFQSDTYFYSFFRKHAGMSPHEYRKKHTR